MRSHEILYRGEGWIEKLGLQKVVLCGAGALGSLLADNMIRLGIQQMRVIDHDRVEQHNVGSQLYGESDIGAFKVDVLRAHCFRTMGIEIEILRKRLDERRVKKMLRGGQLVIDAFDNSASRQILKETCCEQRISCLHLGMNADYGEVRWNEVYRVPADVLEGNACDYPLARNLILLVVAAGSEALMNYFLDGRKDNFAITLRDLKISAE